MYRTTLRKIPVDEKTSVSSAWAVPDDFDAGRGVAVALAHGAGAGMHHGFMRFFHEGLASRGVLCVTFNFPYMERGRKVPDRAGKLEDTFQTIVEALGEYGLGCDRVFLAGKSMGGRIASHLAARESRVPGLILLGYPLHPPGKPERLRDDHFSAIRCPALFLQGTRDALCDLDLLRGSLCHFGGPADLYVVDGGDHSFRVPRSSGKTSPEVLQEVLEVLLAWVRKHSRSQS